MKIPLLHIHIVRSKTLAQLAKDREFSNKVVANLLDNNAKRRMRHAAIYRHFASQKKTKGISHKQAKRNSV